MDSGALLSADWRPLAFDGSQGYRGARARSVALVPAAGGAHCVVVGGSDGALHARYLGAGAPATGAFAAGDAAVYDPARPAGRPAG